MAKNGWGVQGFIATAVGHDEYTLKDLDPINFLLVGISGFEKDYKLADTIMVCSYNPKSQKASILLKNAVSLQKLNFSKYCFICLKSTDSFI